MLFVAAFGSLFVEQAAQLLRVLPSVIEGTLDWLNRRLGTDYEASDLLDAIRLSPEEAAGYAQNVLGGVLGLIGSVAGGGLQLLRDLAVHLLPSADGPAAAAVAGAA